MHSIHNHCRHTTHHPSNLSAWHKQGPQRGFQAGHALSLCYSTFPKHMKIPLILDLYSKHVLLNPYLSVHSFLNKPASLSRRCPSVHFHLPGSSVPPGELQYRIFHSPMYNIHQIISKGQSFIIIS